MTDLTDDIKKKIIDNMLYRGFKKNTSFKDGLIALDLSEMEGHPTLILFTYDGSSLKPVTVVEE
jgi:hypothetical protein